MVRPSTETDWRHAGPATFPKEMSLISAMRNVLDAKDDLQAAIARADTATELLQLTRLCEDVVTGFDHLMHVALKKAERLQQER